MSDISSEKERLLTDATYLEQAARGASKDRTYRLRKADDSDLVGYAEPYHVSAQQLYDGRNLASKYIGGALGKTEVVTNALFRVMIPNYADFGLEEQDKGRQEDLGNKLEEADGHLRNNIIPHLEAALELIREVGQDFEELIGFMGSAEEGFWTKANEMRVQAEDL